MQFLHQRVFAFKRLRIVGNGETVRSVHLWTNWLSNCLFKLSDALGAHARLRRQLLSSQSTAGTALNWREARSRPDSGVSPATGGNPAPRQN